MDQVEDVANLMHASERHLPIKLSAGSGRRDGPKEYDAALPRNLREQVDGLILGVRKPRSNMSPKMRGAG
ncbi:hypothetical protein G3I72_30895 [Pseudomonas aeruginosa]|nr:hypothetical protein [Pseudomonas aeruginosa]